jgi:5-carboxyvanillate decarboxylase
MNLPENTPSQPDHAKSLLTRRTALKQISMSTVAAATGLSTDTTKNLLANKKSDTAVFKIATEEAFNIPEIAEAVRDVIKQGGTNLDLLLLKQIYDAPKVMPPDESTQAVGVSNRDKASQTLFPKLIDIDKIRLTEMDANRVNMHVLSLAMPGVQIFESQKAVDLAHLANDRLSEAILKYPKRFAGLACFATQNPVAAVQEMERSINKLHLNGFIINSHTESSSTRPI